MSLHKQYARRLMESEGYERRILAFRLVDEVPAGVEPYGDDVSFYCAITAEAWDESRSAFYISNKNILCGGGVHCGLGSKPLTRETFDMALAQITGRGGAYATREVMRRVNQQSPHFFRHFTYQVIGALEDVPKPDVVMIVADAHRIMRLCKARTWKTGELTHGIAGTAWCSNSFPVVYRSGTMTFNMGDPPSRRLMNLAPGEMYCLIHYSLLPLIADNIHNVSSGEVL